MRRAHTTDRKNDLKRLSIAGFVVALVLGTTALVALAQDSLLPPLPQPPAWWPATTNSPTVSEWYADLPWHQKLGTYAGNQIDEPIILPYKALPQTDIDFCNANGMPEAKRAECMIEVGVLNILGMYRIDTPYAAPPTIDGNVAQECTDRSLPCIQVMIRVANYYAKSSGGEVLLAARVFGDGRCRTDPLQPTKGCIYDGYTLSDGTTYAPQLPWYMAHYCDGMWPKYDFNDAVCYGDYFSTFIDGFLPYGDYTKWPRSGPWSVWPMQPTTLPPPTPAWAPNTCKVGETACNIVLGAFALGPVTSVNAQYAYNNDLLLQWFTNAWQSFANDQGKDNQYHFPWRAPGQVKWTDFTAQSVLNPFLGTYEYQSELPVVNCNAGLTGPVPTNNDATGCKPDNNGNPTVFTATKTRPAQNLFARQCSLAQHLVSGDAATLRQCALNYELHHNGWTDQWPGDNSWQMAMRNAGMATNQYGRTSFLFAGVPGMQLPVSFATDTGNPRGYSVYEQVYNTSIFSLYLPDRQRGRHQARRWRAGTTTTEFYHTLLMSNHNESDPQHVRRRHPRARRCGTTSTARSAMYDARQDGFRRTTRASGSVPRSTSTSRSRPCALPQQYLRRVPRAQRQRRPDQQGKRTLDAVLQDWGMTSGAYNANVNNDYTFTGEIRPMKLVFFDLQQQSRPAHDASRYSTPLAFTPLTLLQPPRTAQASGPLLQQRGHELLRRQLPRHRRGEQLHLELRGRAAGSLVVPAVDETQESGHRREDRTCRRSRRSSNFTNPDDRTASSSLPAPPGSRGRRRAPT